MTTRFNARGTNNNGVAPLHGGYEGDSTSLVVPPCGIEDVDVSLFRLFDKEIPFTIEGSEGAKKVPVIFAAGEKWALLKRGRPLRDRNGSLIVPLITVVRTGISQDTSTDIAGRGINQQTGELVIRRRLDKTDREYQSLINRINLRGQENTAEPPSTETTGLISLDEVGALNDDPIVSRGGLLKSDRMNNVFETIVIPAPQFYTATYEITFWTQYVVHMNALNETLLASFLPQAQSWKLDTDKGYWFIASVEGGAFNVETNFEDMSQEERYVKLKFTIKVPAYILAPAGPGLPVPVRRYVSSPTVAPDISFNVNPREVAGTMNEAVLGSDDPTLPLTDGKGIRPDQRFNGNNRLAFHKTIDPNDPVFKMVPRGTREQLISDMIISNVFGETVYRSR